MQNCVVQIVLFDRVTGWVRLEGTTVGHPVQPSCSGMVIPKHIASIVSSRFWNIPSGGGLHTFSGQPVQGLVTVQGGNSSSCLVGTSCLWPLVSLLSFTEQNLVHLLTSPCRHSLLHHCLQSSKEHTQVLGRLVGKERVLVLWLCLCSGICALQATSCAFPGIIKVHSTWCLAITSGAPVKVPQIQT